MEAMSLPRLSRNVVIGAWLFVLALGAGAVFVVSGLAAGPPALGRPLDLDTGAAVVSDEEEAAPANSDDVPSALGATGQPDSRATPGPTPTREPTPAPTGTRRAVVPDLPAPRTLPVRSAPAVDDDADDGADDDDDDNDGADGDDGADDD